MADKERIGTAWLKQSGNVMHGEVIDSAGNITFVCFYATKPGGKDFKGRTLVSDLKRSRT